MITQIKKYFTNITQIKGETSFYLQTATKTWLLYCLIYSFMIVQFCWSNHDWWYLKDRIYISDGFFEARYNQHLFSVLFFDGQILPILVYISSFAALTAFSILLAIYLEIPKTEKNWLFFTLFIGLNPHIFVLFSYVFIMLPFICWGSVSIIMLFLLNPPYKSIKIIGAATCALLVLGGYPPIIGLICTTFITKQILLYIQKNISIKQLVKNAIIFACVFISAFLLYKEVIIPIILGNNYNAEMYNTKIISHTEIIQRLGTESLHAITQLWAKYPLLDEGYLKLLLLLIAISFIITLNKSPYKKTTTLLLIGLLLASRIAFLVAENADFAAFRLTYWGKLGLYTFALSILLREKTIFMKNIVFALSIACLCLFVRTDFEIQKIWNLGFKAERLFHTRLVERITAHPSFNLNQHYAFLSFGAPFYKQRYYQGKTILKDNEILNILTLPADLGETLFWEEAQNPIAINFGIWSNRLWKVNNHRNYKQVPKTFTINNDIISQMREWAYSSSEIYPSINSVYINEQYIFVVLDEIIFNKSKELFLTKIDTMLN